MTRSSLWGTAGALLIAALPAGALGAPPAPAIPQVYELVAREEGVPPRILYAVALAESGMSISTGSFRPWPWTLVVRGEPERYPAREPAVERIAQLLAQGVTNVDVGLMQANLHWHGYRFASIEQAIDPWANLRAGARILRSRFESTACDQRWWCAVARYHSFRKAQGEAYARRVQAIHDQFQGG